ncbi:MAG TPA: hypothetical protein VLK65_29990 [Vicinamibacteria bacterium]|nr:hypothetical protein [Vicinamibacteria bacterium]
MRVNVTEVRSILTRTTGYLKTVTSHSLQPYRGCSYGNALCGIGCYVRHNRWITRGQPWGSFLEVRSNAAAVYREQYERESGWARRQDRSRGRFSVFLASSTDPFVPQERQHGISRRVLETMVELPPDELVVQTHSPRVIDYLELYEALRKRCALRVHLSIESDRDGLPGLPPPAASVAHRFEAAAELKRAGVRVVITVSPLLPIERPEDFFRRVARAADAVVIDHFIEGDGSQDGARTRATVLPTVMESVLPGCTALDYRDRMVAVARRILPGKVGVSVSGFGGTFC